MDPATRRFVGVPDVADRALGKLRIRWAADHCAEEAQGLRETAHGNGTPSVSVALRNGVERQATRFHSDSCPMRINAGTGPGLDGHGGSVPPAAAERLEQRNGVGKL